MIYWWATEFLSLPASVVQINLWYELWFNVCKRDMLAPKCSLCTMCVQRAHMNGTPLFVWQSTLPSPFPPTRAAYTTHTGGIQSHRAPEPRVLCCVRCVCTWHYCHSKQRVYAGLFQIQFHTSTHQPHSIGPSTICARSLCLCAS